MALWAVLAGALAAKAIVLAQLADHPLLQPHGELDSTYYIELAQKIADDGPLAVAEPFFVSPLYVFFLAIVFKTGGSLLAAKVTQILLGTVAIWFVYLTARAWFGAVAALAAASLAALTGLVTFYEVLILQAALDPFLVALALYLLTRPLHDDRPVWYVASGAGFGLLTLNRPNALACTVAVIVAFVASAFRPKIFRLKPEATSVRRAALATAGLLLVLLPNALRNYAASGELVWISSHGGLNFYIGNHAGADGGYSPVPGISASIGGQAREAKHVAERAEGRTLSSGEVSRHFYGRAWEWITARPLDAVRLFGWKLLILLNRTNIPLNYSYAYYVKEEPTFLRFLIVGPWLLIPLGIGGLVLGGLGGPNKVRPTTAVFDHRAFVVWASFVPVYALSVAAFFVSDRYRMPLLIPLCVTSGTALVYIADRLRTRRIAVMAFPATAIVAIGVLANWNLGLDDGVGTEQTRKAVWLIESGRFDESRAYVDSIATRHSAPGVFRFRVARALAKAGHADEAISRFREAVSFDQQPAIHLELGQALAAAGRATEAVPHLETALSAGFERAQSGPWLVRALAMSGNRVDARRTLSALPGEVAEHGDTAFDLGSIALELEAPVEAERWLRRAVARFPTRADAHEQLGLALLFQRRAVDAVAPLETAVRLDASRASAHLNLAVVYAEVGRTNDARREAEESLRLDPREERTRQLLKALTAARTGRPS